MKEDDIVIAEFGEEYIKFINHCFLNFLISAVEVEIDKSKIFSPKGKYFLKLKIAAPGIDRIKNAIDKFSGVLVKSSWKEN